MLYHNNNRVPGRMHREKKEGNQLRWVQAVSDEGGCRSVFNGGKEFGQEGQIPALLDHHHLHLHLHLLHKHLQRLQRLLHPVRCQPMLMVYQYDAWCYLLQCLTDINLWTQRSMFSNFFKRGFKQNSIHYKVKLAFSLQRWENSVLNTEYEYE